MITYICNISRRNIFSNPLFYLQVLFLKLHKFFSINLMAAAGLIVSYSAYQTSEEYFDSWHYWKLFLIKIPKYRNAAGWSRFLLHQERCPKHWNDNSLEVWNIFPHVGSNVPCRFLNTYFSNVSEPTPPSTHKNYSCNTIYISLCCSVRRKSESA